MRQAGGRMWCLALAIYYALAAACSGATPAADAGAHKPLKPKPKPDAAADALGTAKPGRAQPVADELADRRGLERLSDWRALPLLSEPNKYRQQTSADRGTFDDSFPLSSNGNRDFNNFICASSDAQLDSLQIAPFKFDQTECQDAYARGVVIGRFEGPGRLVRVWLGAASLLNAPADAEVFRVYIDDDPTPKIEVPLADALIGSAGEIFAPPFGAASPRRMAWYYPVAFTTKLVVAIDGLGPLDEYYYHCDVVSDAEPASDPLPAARLAERDQAVQQLTALDAPVSGAGALGEQQSIALDAGASQTVRTAGPATVYALRVTAEGPDPSSLAGVRLAVRWDDAQAAAIDLALLELLGANRVAPEKPSLALRSFLTGGKRVLELRLPMPFATAAEWTFTDEGKDAAHFDFELLGEPRVPAAAFGHLHTQRRETLGPTTLAEHVAVDAQGHGRLVGVCVLDEGHADPSGGVMTDPLNMLEGDVRATVDGELALDGTGSEEYADDIFYFKDAPHGNAFVQAWGVFQDNSRKPPGQASFCRWHVLGTELDFGSSIQLSFELGGAGNPGVVERMQTVAYLYLPD